MQNRKAQVKNKKICLKGIELVQRACLKVYKVINLVTGIFEPLKFSKSKKQSNTQNKTRTNKIKKYRICLKAN